MAFGVVCTLVISKYHHEFISGMCSLTNDSVKKYKTNAGYENCPKACPEELDEYGYNWCVICCHQCIGFEKYGQNKTATWGSWHAWSPCFGECGSGFRHRLRTCASSDNLLCKLKNGSTSDVDEELRKCNIDRSCPPLLNWLTMFLLAANIISTAGFCIYQYSKHKRETGKGNFYSPRQPLHETSYDHAFPSKV